MPQKKSARKSKPKYDCLDCPAYCCSYAHIPATDEDVERLADHFDLTLKEALRRVSMRVD